MNDVRDEAVGVALDRVARLVEVEPADRLHEVLRRGGRDRAARFTVIVAAVAVFVGAVTWTGLSMRGGIPADIADWNTFASLEDNGWTVQVPSSWRVQELPACPNAPERIGVIVTNTDFEFLNPRGESPRCEDRFVFQGFSRDGVALAFMPVGIRIGMLFEGPDTVLPLSPDLLIDSGGIRGGPAHSFESIWVGGEHLAIVRRFVGRDAPATDVTALDRMLSSFRVRGARLATEDGGSVTLRDDRRGYTVTYPAGWTFANENLTPWLTTPDEILSLGTFPFRTSRDPEDGLRIWDAPVAPAALADMTSRDVFISLQERHGGFGGDHLPRPSTFGPRGCEEAIEGCGPSEVPFAAWWIPFEDAGRAFYLFVAIGDEATRDLGDAGWAVADSLSFATGR